MECLHGHANAGVEARDGLVVFGKFPSDIWMVGQKVGDDDFVWRICDFGDAGIGLFVAEVTVGIGITDVEIEWLVAINGFKEF